MKKITLALLAVLFYGCAEKIKVDPVITENGRKWWKEAIIYQIYPRSFKDTNGDGVGDINGIIEKLDYIKSLGVTAVWLNPIYSSPNDDNGYDVSDYTNILPEFGTLADFDRLVKGMHERDIKLVMDVVVNHSSDEHEWFKQARSSRTNAYRDYYHWWPAEKGTPPYRYSLFDEKGDAWKFDSVTNSYYLHYFSQKQPDLNWENPQLRQEVYRIMRFWAEKGVDGFRLDAFQFAAKDTTFPIINDDLEKNFIQYYAMQNGLHEYLKEMNQAVFTKYNVMSVAEGAGRNFEDAHNLVDKDRKELDMAYAFEGVDIAKPEGYSLTHFKEVYSKWDHEFSEKGWLSIFLSNHDQARMVSRWANDGPQYRSAATKMLNTFILSMRGTPYCYYGDELGMTNIGFDSIAQYRDIAAINGYKKVVNSNGDIAAYMKNLKFGSRDNGRTPMQWDTTEHAAFTTGKPWLPVNGNHDSINVALQESDPNSVLTHFKKMTKLRKDAPLLVYGDYQLLLPDDPKIYAYTRTFQDECMLVVLNFSNEPTLATLPSSIITKNELINNYDHIDLKGNEIVMQPYQAVIFAINQ